MYLREMGTVKLLDREGEVRIAKRIEQGEAKIYQALANNPVVLEEILKLLENAGRDSRIVDELVNAADEDDEDEPEERPRRPRDPADRGHPRTASGRSARSTKTSSG